MTRIRIRRGTAASWAGTTTPLLAGEPGWVSDTGALLIGDGATTPGSLPQITTRPPVWAPTDQGFIGWAFDPVSAGSADVISTSGVLKLAKIWLPGSTVTSLVVAVTVAGTSLTSGQCGGALYTAAGAKVAQTADQSTAWATTGVKTMALVGGPYALPAGFYYTGIWINHTGTSPSFSTGAQTAVVNAGASGASLRFCNSAETGITTTAPATVTVGSSTISWWMGLK